MFNNLKYNFFRSKYKNNPTYIDAEIVQDDTKIIIRCRKCQQKLRIPFQDRNKLHVTCPECKNSFKFNCQRYRLKIKLLFHIKNIVLLLFLIINIVFPIYLFSDLSLNKLNNTYKEIIKQRQYRFSKELNVIKDEYDLLIKEINTNDMRLNSDKHYTNIWNERNNYIGKYAITPREKAQLEMFIMSKDKTKKIDDIIKGIASKAAPKNSEIIATAKGDKYNLDINFDMSVLAPEEKGTSTQHESIYSLKRHVICLISKTTNDVYHFCQDLDLDSISIGCRHYVRQFDEYKNYKGEVNTVLYKIRLNKKDLSEIKNNPYLDTFSTTKYFKIEKDDFPNIEIKRELH